MAAATGIPIESLDKDQMKTVSLDNLAIARDKSIDMQPNLNFPNIFLVFTVVLRFSAIVQ